MRHSHKVRTCSRLNHTLRHGSTTQWRTARCKTGRTLRRCWWHDPPRLQADRCYRWGQFPQCWPIRSLPRRCLPIGSCSPAMWMRYPVARIKYPGCPRPGRWPPAGCRDLRPATSYSPGCYNGRHRHAGNRSRHLDLERPLLSPAGGSQKYPAANCRPRRYTRRTTHTSSDRWNQYCPAPHPSGFRWSAKSANRVESGTHRSPDSRSKCTRYSYSSATGIKPKAASCKNHHPHL